jgi:hypothetical protein
MATFSFSDRIKNHVAVGYVCIVSDELNSVQVLSRVKNDFHHAVVFIGKRSKPAWQSSGYSRPSDFTFIHCLQHVQRFYESIARENQAHDVVVGEIFIASWGCEQTNIDYFQVIKLVGKKMIEVHEIESLHCATGDMSGKCAPIKNAFKGESFRVKVSLWSDRPSFNKDCRSAFLERGDMTRCETSYA